MSPNPNERTKSKSKCRKYRRRANQIKSNGAPAETKQIKSKSNTGPENPNGTNKWRRARAPPFGDLTALALTKIDALLGKSIIVDIAIPNP
jgi:hypothetical protein